MRIAACSFAVTGSIQQNMKVIQKAIGQAAAKDADLIVFPECAITGCPPRDISVSCEIDYSEVQMALDDLQQMADSLDIAILIGTAFYDGTLYYNRAYLFVPGKTAQWYGKRALYGWDEENFSKGAEDGVFEVKGFSIGVRICFEVRFPEYFRELYRAHTDLNIVLFYDVSDTDDLRRYQLIRSHLATRAVENVTPVLSVNTISPYQTAPTCFVDASGNVIAETQRNEEAILFYDFEKKELNFGEQGRKRYSDELTGLR